MCHALGVFCHLASIGSSKGYLHLARFDSWRVLVQFRVILGAFGEIQHLASGFLRVTFHLAKFRYGMTFPLGEISTWHDISIWQVPTWRTFAHLASKKSWQWKKVGTCFRQQLALLPIGPQCQVSLSPLIKLPHCPELTYNLSVGDISTYKPQNREKLLIKPKIH